MNEKPLQTLHRSLLENGYDIPEEYDVFESTLQEKGEEGYNNRYNLWRSLRENDYDVPDNYDDFRDTLFKVPDEPQQQPQSYNPLEDNIGAGVGAAIEGTPLSDEDRRSMMQSVLGAKRQAAGAINPSRLDALDTYRQNVKPFDVHGIGESSKVAKGPERFNAETGEFERQSITSQGNEYGNDAIAQMEQGAIDQQERDERYRQSLPGQLEDAYAEREQLQAQLKALGRDNTANYSPMYGGAQVMGVSPELRKKRSVLMAAIRQNNQRITALEAERDDEGQSMFWRGFLDTITDPDTYSFGVTGLGDASNMLALKNKIDQAKAKGVEPVFTDEEQTLIRNIQNNQYAQSTFGKNRGSMYTFGSGFAQSIPFMVEIAATGGMGGLSEIGFSAGKRFAVKTVEKAVEKTMLRNLGKGGKWVADAVVKGSGALGGITGGGLIMATTTGSAKTGADIVDRYVGQMTINDDGSVDFKDGASIGESVANGVLSQAFEYGSELIGDKYIEKFMPVIGESVKKAIQKMGPEKARQFLEHLLTNKYVQGAKGIVNNRYFEKGEKVLNYTGIQGWLAEGMEEEANNILNAIFVGDVTFFKKDSDKAAIFDTKDQFDLWAQTVLTSAILRAPQMVATTGKAAGYYQYKLATDVADTRGQSVFGAENWQMIKESIDNCQNDDLSTLLKSVINGDMSQQQKEATLWYADNLLKMRGYNAALMADVNSGNSEDAELNEWLNSIDQQYTIGHETQIPDEKKAIIDEASAAAEQLKKYGNEFAIMVQAEDDNPANLIDYLLNNRDIFTDEQIAGATDYLQKKAKANGVLTSSMDNVDLAVEKANAEVMSNTHQQSGMMVTAQSGDDTFYVLGGEFATDTGGNILPELIGTGGAVVVKNVETGEVTVKSPVDISVLNMVPSDLQIQQNESILREQLIQQADDELTYGSPAQEIFDLYDAVALNDGNGGIVEGSIVGMPNAVDGVYTVQTADNKLLMMTADELNMKIAGHNGQVVQRAGTMQQEQPQEEQAQQAVEQQQPIQTQEQGTQAGAEAAPEEASSANEAPASALSRIPVRMDESGHPVTNKKGKPILDWHKASKEDATAALIETTGGDLLMARDTATDLINKGKEQLEKIRKQKPKGDDPLEIAESRMEIKRQEQEQQAINKQWSDVNQLVQKFMRQEAEQKQAEREAAKSAEQKAREAEEARIRKERQDEEQRKRIREQIEKDKEKRNREYQPLTKAKEELAGDTDAMSVLDTIEPQTLEERVSSMIRPHSMLWLDSSASEIGLQSELGLQRGDMQRMMNLLGNKENGAKPFGQVVLDIYENLPDAMKEQYTDQDVRNTLLDIFNEGSSGRMMHLTEEHRIEEAREIAKENARREAEAELEAWAEANHMTPEEFETYKEFMQQPPSEPEQEIINNIIADEQFKQSLSEGTELDQQSVSRGNVQVIEGGESQVQQTGETAGNGDNANAVTQGEETSTGEQTVVDNNVPGRTQSIEREYVRELLRQMGEDFTIADDMSDYEVEQLNAMGEDWDAHNDDYGLVMQQEGENLKSKDKKVRDEAQTKVNEAQAVANEAFEPIAQYIEELKAKYANVEEEGVIPRPKIDTPRFNELYQQLEDAYSYFLDTNDDSELPSATQAIREYVDEGLDFHFDTEDDTNLADWVFDYKGDDPEKLAQQYIGRVYFNSYLDDDEDQEYIRTGVQSNKRFDNKFINGFEVNDYGVCINPHKISEHKEKNNVFTGYEINTAETDKGWVGAASVGYSTGGWSSPVTAGRNDNYFETEKECQSYWAGIVLGYIEGTAKGDKKMAKYKPSLNAIMKKAPHAQPITQSEQLKPVDARDAVRPESAEIGVNEANTRAKEKSFFGRIYSQFKGKAKEAAKFLLQMRNGTAKAVYHRDEVGDIDLVWGNGKAGLEHIIYKHVINHNDFNSVEEAIDIITDVVNNGTIEIQNDGRTAFVKDNYRVAIEKGDDGNWIVTALDQSRKKKEKKRSEQDATILHQSIFGEENGELVSQQPAISLGKGTDNSSNIQENLGKTSSQAEISFEESKVDTNPSEAQKEAGNYQKGHIKIDGFDVTIENPKGSIRRGTDSDGKQWEQEMHNTYGYIKGTEGVDGDHIDVFLSDNPASGKVWVIDQVNPKTGEFDEHKVMYGFANGMDATKAYLSNYEDGWQGLGSISGISRDEFKKWVESSHRKTKPFRDYALAKSAEAKEKKAADGEEGAQEPTKQEPKRLVSDDRMEELKKRLRSKLGGQLNAGVDPELIAIGAEMAVGYIERGVTKFADYAKAMITEVGEFMRPYLKSFYNAVRDMPQAYEYANQMDDYDTVSKFDVFNFDKQKQPTVIEKAEQVEKERKVRTQAKKIQAEQPSLFDDMFAEVATEPQQTERKKEPAQQTEQKQQAKNETVKSKGRKLNADELGPVRTGKRFKMADGTVEIARVDYDRLVVWDIDENGNRSNKTRGINTVDIIDGLKTGVVTPVEKAVQSKEPVLRPATEADLDAEHPVVYYQGKPYNIIAVMRSGEQISATQFSKPVVDSVMLTNGKSVKLSDLMVEDKEAKQPKRKTAWWSDPSRPQSIDPSNYETYTTQEAKDYFAQFKAQPDEKGKVFPDFTKWAHPNLAYITAAAWDGAVIPVDVLRTIPEITEAQNALRQGKLKISDEELEKHAMRLLDDEHGSAVYNKRGKVADYTGAVKHERKAFFVIGRPAGGKSSVFADPLSRDNSARIIDADVVKPWLEGYDGGNGAGYVQKASSDVMERALEIAAERGDNIVVPKIGGGSVAELATSLCLVGYDVQLLYNDVSQETSIMRAASRFAETGRYLSLEYLTEIKNKPTDFFSKFAERKIGDYINERTEEELQNIRGRLERLHSELYGSGEGLRMLRTSQRTGEGASDEAVQGTLGFGELSDGSNGVQILLRTPIFSYSEWKSNDVAFGEKPKEIWNSASGKPLSDVLKKKKDDARNLQQVEGQDLDSSNKPLSGESSERSTADNGRLESDIQERGNDERRDNGVSQGDGAVSGRSSGQFGHVSGQLLNQQQPAKPKQALHNNKRNNQGERGKDYAPTSPKARFNANVEAIKMMRALMEDGIEAPTKDQMEVLRQYSGWGGLGTFFNEEGTAENNILRELLSDEEYQNATLSIKTAYYTPAYIIDSLWDIAKALGFEGGNVLEGSAGIGNIIGQMPQELSRQSNIEAVEIDKLTGNILKLLYPDAKVHIEGFQDTQIRNGSVDLAITNVPFASDLNAFDKIDKDLSRRFRTLHDFCIAKNIRKLKQGGIGIFISSSGTLDKSTDLRAWITDEGQADVIGAFRLNNETFGGTKATSDIIVVRKRVNGKKSAHAIDVSQVTPMRIGTYKDKWGDEHQVSLDVNNYFHGHPEMMAGEMAFGYERGDTYRAGSYGLYPVDGKSQAKMLNDFVKSMKNAKEEAAPQEEQQPIENQLTAVKEGRMLIDDNGRLCVSQLGVARPLGVNDNKVKGQTKQQCFKDYQAVQKAVDDVLQQQLNDPDDAALKPKLDTLNKVYDAFVNRYGIPYKNTSISFLRNDIDYPSFVALASYSEKKDMKGKVTITSEKSPLFMQRVLGFKTEPKPKTVKDAVIASIFRTNTIDLDWMAEKLGMSVDDVRRESLESRMAFENPSTGAIEVRHQYLSGNVREKLAIAEEYNANGETTGRYSANVEELKKVVPMDIPAHLIDFSLGSSWIPTELYQGFIKESLGLDDVKLAHLQGRWTMTVNEWSAKRSETNKAKGVYSEQFKTNILGSDLVLSALNNRPYKVSRVETSGWGDSKTQRTVVDQNATQACNVRIDELKDEFKQYVHKRVQDDAELARNIEKVYNDKFNALVPLHVDDDMLPERFENSSKKFNLYDHQKRGVMRGIISPTMLAHEVGTGKSFTLISTAMEMRRLGTAKKPMIVVQNATVAQMTSDAKSLYPNAKVLSLSEQDRDAEGRRAFYAKIKYNDWDMIIIPQSTLDRIPDAPERELQFIKEQIDEKKHLIELARQEKMDVREIGRMERELAKKEQEYGDKYLDSDPANASNAPKRKKDAKREAASLDKAETKAQEKLDRATDDVQSFDDLGIDAILVDEAHGYKHLGFETSLGRSVKGVDPSFSKKCAGLYNKTRAVFEKAGWKNVVFATGTPISNTAAEIWTFMKYLMPADVMKANDIYYFDDFVHNFGAIQQMLEFKTNGKFNEVTRFAAYVNRPELMRIWMQVADIVRTEEVSEVKSKVPEKENGKDQDVFLPQSPSLVRVMNAVRAELERFENMDGKQKKENSSIPLTMYGIAKRAAIDPRLVDPEAPDEAMSKTNAAVSEIVKDLKSTQKYNGTVAVFCDNQNRLDGNGNVEFNIFDDMKAKLVRQGVPEKQIAIIKSSMSITAKQKVFDAVNKGEIRVIMGSTQTLGTGVNIQERLHCLIHMDAPDRPMDYTQRNGRIERQGNLHRDWGIPIRILRFGVEDSLDVTAYQRLKTKSGFIDSIMNGKGALANNQTDRTIEEEEEGLFDNPVAVLSGSQFALKKNQAERQLRKMRGKYSAWEADQIYVSSQLKANDAWIENRKQAITEFTETLDKIRSMFPDGKPKVITVQGVKVDMSADDADKKLNAAIKEKIGDPVNAIVKRNRENQIYNDETLEYTIELDGHPVQFKVEVYRTSDWDGGKMRHTIHKRVYFKSNHIGFEGPTLGNAKTIRENLDEILEHYVSGTDLVNAIENAKSAIERTEESTKQLKEREGQPFQFTKELKDAEEQVEEYTELMKQEMKEKEAKYAEQMKAAKESGESFDLNKAKEISEEDEDKLYRDDSVWDDGPIFYSNAMYAVENIRQEKAMAEQWLAMIQKNGGLKAGEDKWLGLSDFLNQNKGKSLTKQEVINFILQHEIEVLDVDYKEYDPDDDMWDGKWIEPTRLNYTTEGLENNREIALIVPQIESYKPGDKIHFGDAGSGRAVAWARFGETTDADGNRVLVIDEIQSNRHQDGREKGYAKLSDIRFQDEYNTIREDMVERYGAGVMSNWREWKEIEERDKPLLERAERIKAILVNEVYGQVPEAPFEKNWHEVAMKRMLRYAAENGYDKIAWTTGEQQAERYNISNVVKHIDVGSWGEDANGNELEGVHDAYKGPSSWEPSNDIEKAIKEYIEYCMSNGDSFLQAYGYALNQITDAPEESKGWTTEAVNKVSDAIEADLKGTKDMRGVVIDLVGEGDMIGMVVNRDGRIIDSSTFDFIGKSLADVVGKEVALKIINTEHNKRLSGNNLRIGGEGMKGFYDQMLVRFMEKYGKKWGVSVYKTELPNVEAPAMWTVDITNEMRESVLQGQPLFRGMDMFADGETFPIEEQHNYGTNVLSDNVAYSTELMPDVYSSKQQLLDALRVQYPAYYIYIEDGNVKMESWDSVLASARENVNLSKRAEAGKKNYIDRKTRNAINAVNSLAKMMGLDVEVLTTTEGLKGKDAMAKGWFDRKTGKIKLVLPNHVNKSDLINTLLHEGVAHYGLRKMFGVHFDTFLDNVYYNVSPEIKARIDRAAKNNKVDRRTMTEEYLARLAERTDFEHAIKRGWFQKIKDFFMQLLTKIGLKLDSPITDDELRYILWRSYDNLLHPGRRNIFDKAQDVMMQSKLHVGRYSDDMRPASLAGTKRVAAEVKSIHMSADELIESVKNSAIRNYKDELSIRDRVKELSYDDVKYAYGKVNSSMLDEEGLNIDEHEEKIKRDWIDKHGLDGVGRAMSDELKKQIEKYGSGMITLRWELLDRLEELDNMPEKLERSGYTREIWDIINKAMNEGTLMLAPNGKLSNLRDQLQWAQVRTKAFKEWFGDWENDPEHASKVVDENGEPKVMYHGTKLANVGLSEPFWEFYDKSHFGTKGQAMEFVQDETGTAKPHMYEVFLNIRNPQRRSEPDEEYLENKDMTFREYWEQSVERSKGRGHDGIVYLNEFEDRKHPADSWIIFNPNQVKSATDNSGDFSTEDNDIRYRTIGGNKGYVGYSKSVRAVEAEKRGLRNKSQMDKDFADEVNDFIRESYPDFEGVSLAKIKAALPMIHADEWHHTSKFGNRTNYYSVKNVAEYFMPESKEIRDWYDDLQRKREELSLLTIELSQELYDKIPYEKRGYVKYFRTSKGHLVQLTSDAFDADYKHVLLIPAGEDERVAYYDHWAYEHPEEFKNAAEEFISAKRKAFETLSKEKKDKVVELRQQLYDAINDNKRYSIRTKEAPKKTGKGYKVFVLKDGELYPPMVANPNGEGTPVGVWLDADAAPVVGESKTGRPQVKAGGKGTQGGSGQLAYRPGWHLGTIPYALQFNRKDANGEKTLFPNNFVWAEVEYADDVDYQNEARQEGVNANGKYQHALAGLKHVPEDGSYRYRTNPDPRTDEWVITGAMRVNRILTRDEVDELVRKAGREPQKIQDGDILTDEIVEQLNHDIEVTKEADSMGLLYRDDSIWDEAQYHYEKEVAKKSLQWQEAWQDSMISLKTIQDAIAKETGNVATGAEDAYRFENRMHGRAKNMSEQYDWNFYRPMLKAFNDFCKVSGITQERGIEYLVCKSGLERNMFFAFRNALKEKIAEDIKKEREQLEKEYAKKAITEDEYKLRKQQINDKEKTAVDDAIQAIQETIAWKRAREDHENGTINFGEYLRRREALIEAEVGSLYKDYSNDYSGLTETMAKEMYDDAQDTKRAAQRAIDPQERRKLWSQYNKEMKQAYDSAKSLAEDEVFVAEKDNEELVNKLWNAINAATKETLRHSFESGMIERDTYNKVREMFDYYLPLRGWDEDKASDVYTYMGKDNVFSTAVKKAWGRTSRAENPLAYIGNIAVSTIIAGNRNLMKQHFLNYVMNNPTSLVSISESWYENIGDEDNPMWILRSADTAGLSPDEVAQVVADFNEEMAQKQAAGYAMPVRGRLRLDVHATSGQKNEHVVEVQRAGHIYQLYINGNPKAAQALNGTLPKAVSRISDTYIGKWLTKLNRSMAAFFTSKNPAFIVSNLSRDLNMAGASVRIMEDNAYNARFVANVAKVLSPRIALGDVSTMGVRGLVGKGRGVTGMMPKLLAKWKEGKLDTRNETERMFKEFMDEGGETGFVNMLSVDSFKEKMEKEIAQMNGSSFLGKNIKETTVHKGLRILGDTFEFYNRCAEDATRFIVYMTSRQMGKSMEDAIADAKDVTLNFNRKGTGDRGNAEIRDLFIFVNPAIQALGNMYRMATGKPLRFSLVTSLFVTGGMLMPILNQWLLNMFGDDDDKQSYWNLPPWVRKNNLVIWIPFTKNFLTIPLAQEFRVFYGVGEMMASAVLDHPVENAGLEIVSSVADLVPINPTGNGSNLIINFAPTGSQPIAQLAFNTDFTGRPIWKENQGNKFAPMYTKAYVTTPKWMVKVSEGINTITGGNEGKKGVIEHHLYGGEYLNNPAVWNHLLQGYFGGMYNTIAKTFDVTVTAASGEMPKVYQTPIINRFLNRPVERDNAGALGDEYYNLVEKRDALNYELRVWQKKAADGEEGAQEHVEEIMESPEYNRGEVITHYEKIIKELRAGEKAATDSEQKDNIKLSINLYKQQMMEELSAIDEGKEPLQAAMEQFDNAKSMREKKKILLRVERLVKRQMNAQSHKRKSSSEDVEKALAYSQEEADANSQRYLQLATSQDIYEDAKIKAARARIKQYVDNFKRLQDQGKTDEALKYRNDNQKWFVAEQQLNSLSHTMATNKKMLGMGRDKDVMKLIGNIRKTMLKAIEKLDDFS